jgi:hypothetical protein
VDGASSRIAPIPDEGSELRRAKRMVDFLRNQREGQPKVGNLLRRKAQEIRHWAIPVGIASRLGCGLH